MWAGIIVVDSNIEGHFVGFAVTDCNQYNDYTRLMRHLSLFFVDFLEFYFVSPVFHYDSKVFMSSFSEFIGDLLTL